MHIVSNHILINSLFFLFLFSFPLFSISDSNDDIVSKYIAQLKLEPHPEGGLFALNYTADYQVKYEGEYRKAGSSIYYLLRGNEFSTWHKLKEDEIWHFYTGDSLTIYYINRDSNKLMCQKLGNPLIHENAKFQLIIGKNNWFAAKPDNEESFSLVGCTLCPGYVHQEYAEKDDINNFLENNREHEAIIKALYTPR